MTTERDLIQALTNALEVLYKEAVTAPHFQTLVIGGTAHPIPIGNDLIVRDAIYADLLTRARAFLDQPEPEELTEEEILDLSEEHGVSYTTLGGVVIHPYQEVVDIKDDVLSFARALIAADRARCGRNTTTETP